MFAVYIPSGASVFIALSSHLAVLLVPDAAQTVWLHRWLCGSSRDLSRGLQRSHHCSARRVEIPLGQKRGTCSSEMVNEGHVWVDVGKCWNGMTKRTWLDGSLGGGRVKT